MNKSDYLWIGFIIGALVYGWVLPWVDKKVTAYYERKGK